MPEPKGQVEEFVQNLHKKTDIKKTFKKIA